MVSRRRRRRLSREGYRLALVLTIGPAASHAEPNAASEFLRLPDFTTPLYVESRQFWAFSPKHVVLVEGQQSKATFRGGADFLGELATVASTTKGWLIGSTAGVWEVRVNDGDLRHLPEMGEEGVYRFGVDVGFTDHSLFRLERPWERFEFGAFTVRDVNDWVERGDTLTVATRQGVKRLIWSRAAWDDAPLGPEAEKSLAVRFLDASALNETDAPDSSAVQPLPLLVAENRVFYEDAGNSQWTPIEGLRFDGFANANADSVYRRIRNVVFHDEKGAGGGESTSWYRWLVTPTGVGRLELPHRGVPVVIGHHSVEGDVRDTYVDGPFVWVATTEDLYAIDREFDNVDQFIAEDDFFVWGFLGEPLEFTAPRQEERGWYAISSEGMTEVFTESWSWDAYGLDAFDATAVWAAAADVDGFWVGTSSGLRWFSAVTRTWDRSVVPSAMAGVPIYRLEWKGNDLIALTGSGVFSSTKRARTWRHVASFEF